MVRNCVEIFRVITVQFEKLSNPILRTHLNRMRMLSLVGACAVSQDYDIQLRMPWQLGEYSQPVGGICSKIWFAKWKSLFRKYADNKGPDHPAHSPSLIKDFVVPLTDAMAKLVIIRKSRFWPGCVSIQIADLNSRWSHMDKGPFLESSIRCFIPQKVIMNPLEC